MNLLLPSVGRKVPLVRMFREALSRRGGRVIAADVSPLASGLYAADERALLPPFGSEGFWEAVDALIRRHRIDAVVPARDAELAGWAARAEEGRIAARIVLSPSATLALCRDKLALAGHAAGAGLACPETLLAEPGGTAAHLGWPVVLKPRRGAGSRGVRLAPSAAFLAAELETAGEELILQEHVRGPEYTVDAYVSATGEFLAAVVRRRLSVVNGQSDVGETVTDEELAALARRLAEATPFRGAVNMQFIRGDDGPRLIDVNPRFSGGIAITRAAGIDFAEWTVRELAGEPVDAPRAYRLVTFLGYSDGFSMPSGDLAGKPRT